MHGQMNQQPLPQKWRGGLAVVVEHIGDGVISHRADDGFAPAKAEDLIRCGAVRLAFGENVEHDVRIEENHHVSRVCVSGIRSGHRRVV